MPAPSFPLASGFLLNHTELQVTLFDRDGMFAPIPRHRTCRRKDGGGTEWRYATSVLLTGPKPKAARGTSPTPCEFFLPMIKITPLARLLANPRRYVIDIDVGSMSRDDFRKTIDKWRSYLSRKAEPEDGSKKL